MSVYTTERWNIHLIVNKNKGNEEMFLDEILSWLLIYPIFKPECMALYGHQYWTKCHFRKAETSTTFQIWIVFKVGILELRTWQLQISRMLSSQMPVSQAVFAWFKEAFEKFVWKREIISRKLFQELNKCVLCNASEPKLWVYVDRLVLTSWLLQS